MRYRQIGFFFASWLLISAAMADVLQLKEGHPESYVVQKGDTLWDISGHFLKSPSYGPGCGRSIRKLRIHTGFILVTF